MTYRHHTRVSDSVAIERPDDPAQCNCHREPAPCLNCRVNAGEFTDIGVAEWLTEDE